MSGFRGLDDRLLPVVAGRVQAWRQALRRTAERAPREPAPAAPPAAEAKGLRLLDERYASRGPLALMREVPQLGFVVIGLVFLAGTGTAVSRDAEKNRLAQQQVVTEDPGIALPGEDATNRTLGPMVGDTITGYRASSSQALAAAAKAGGDRIALVSLQAYLTPAQVKQLLGTVSVDRVYLRSRAGGKDAAQLPIDVSGGFSSALTKGYAQAAHSRLLAQKAYQGYVSTLTVTTKEDQDFKDLYAAYARSTGAEAHDYEHSCACVYAAVVTGSAKALQALAGASSVRAVQAAPKGVALKALDVQAVLPEVTGTVPVATPPVQQP